MNKPMKGQIEMYWSVVGDMEGIAPIRWISVKDSLPDDFVEVLTCDCRGNIHIMFHHHTYDKPFGIDRHNPRYYMVRWWLPIPNPPKSCKKQREAADNEQIQLEESLL